MSTMLAYRIHRFGGPEVFKSESIEIPEPEAGEVLVRVRTASANPVDIKTREGKYPLITEDMLPYTLGRDFAGVVERVGSEVEEWKRGDEVYGFVGQGQGAYAEFVIVDASALARSPTKVNAITAGAVPLAALTAWQGLFDHGGLDAGQRVLIHAGGGCRPPCRAVCQASGCRGFRYRVWQRRRICSIAGRRPRNQLSHGAIRRGRIRYGPRL